MNINEEMARVEILALDALLDRGDITYDKYIEEIKKIDGYYGTHLYIE